MIHRYIIRAEIMQFYLVLRYWLGAAGSSGLDIADDHK